MSHNIWTSISGYWYLLVIWWLYICGLLMILGFTGILARHDVITTNVKRFLLLWAAFYPFVYPVIFLVGWIGHLDNHHKRKPHSTKEQS